MKKIFSLLFFASIMQQAIAQTETFDIATYTPPKDWKRAANKGAVTYTDVDSTKGTFCMVAMYLSSPSLGDAQKDFTFEWNDVVVDVYHAQTDPKTVSQTTADGWKVVTAAAPIKLAGLDAYAILTVFSGFQRKFSVVTTLNDQSYVNGIDSFIGNISLSKTGGIAVTQNSIPVSEHSNGTKGHFGTVGYTQPDRWKIEKYPDGDILTPVVLPDKEFLEIWVQESVPFSGTMEQMLQKSYDETAEKLKAKKMNDVNGGNYSKEAVKKSFRGWEYIRCSGGIQMGGGDYPPEYGLDLFLIKVNDRCERIAIIQTRNNCDYSTYYPSSRLTYFHDIQDFLFTLQIDGWKDSVVENGTIKGEGITGVWQGIGLSAGMAKTGADLGAELKVKQAIFFSNGQAYFGTKFPVEGLDEFNTWVQAELNRRDWGTYHFSNGKGVLKLPYGEIPLRMENSKLIITTNNADHGFIKINSVDGAKFNGDYALSSKNYAGEETGKTPVISFTGDGKFKDNGALKILYHANVECLNDAKEPGSGTYDVKNNSVIFNFTDGRKIKIAFIGSEYDKNKLSPATLTLSFNEDLLKKQ